MKTIILDTESNGMRPEQICQLAYVISDDGMVTGRNFFFSVDCMNEYALKKHKLSKKRLYDLSGARKFQSRFDEIYQDFDTADMLVGHNLAADVRMMKVEYSRCNAEFPLIKPFCTMKHYQTAMHLRGRTGQRKPPRLDELCRYFRITDERVEAAVSHIFGSHNAIAHDARFDATATYLCVYEAQQRGDIRGLI